MFSDCLRAESPWKRSARNLRELSRLEQADLCILHCSTQVLSVFWRDVSCAGTAVPNGEDGFIACNPWHRVKIYGNTKACNFPTKNDRQQVNKGKINYERKMNFRKKQSWFLVKKKNNTPEFLLQKRRWLRRENVSHQLLVTPWFLFHFSPRPRHTPTHRRYLHLCCPLLPVSGRASCSEGVAVIDAAHFLLCDDVKHTVLHLVALVSS